MSATLEHEGQHHDQSILQRKQALQDLTQGEVHMEGSSYVGKQNEVKGMLDAMEHSFWPGLIYEFLQGALDHEDPKIAAPAIKIFSDSPSLDNEDQIITTEIPYEDFITRYRTDEGRDSLPHITRIVFVNHINNQQGLRPTDLTLTNHEEKGQVGTLGIHGRGSKIATTAALAGQHARKVSFSSYAHGIGAWYGEAKLEENAVDPIAPKALKLKYKRDKTLEQDTTEITLHDPSFQLLNCLTVLPDRFLPANPKYEHYRLGETAAHPLKNQFTMYIRGGEALQEHEATVVYVRPELYHARQMGAEAARVEVLSPQLIGESNSRLPINYVYIDGLQVSAPGEDFSQVYAFWGLGECDDGYNPKRSNDSLRMQNSARNILGEMFLQCDNPYVFAEVLRGLQTLPQTLYERAIPYWNLHHSALAPEAETALLKGWAQVATDSGVYVTSSQEAYQRAQKENLKTIFLGSSNWVSLLTEADPRIKTVDQVFSMQAEVERAKLAEAQRLLRQTQLEQEEKVRRAERDAVKKYLEERGITEDVKTTGEVIKIPQPESIQSFLDMGTLHLIFALAQNEGTLRQLEEHTYRFELRADDFSTAPTTVGQIGPIGQFATSFVAAYHGKSSAELTIIRDQTGRLFTLQGGRTPDALNNMTVHVSAADAALPFHSLMRLDCRFPTEEQSATILAEYPRSLELAIATLLGEDGKVDKNKYLATEYYDQYPPAAELMRVRAAVEKSRHDIRQRILLENVNRRKFGLPPIPDPYLGDEEKEAQAKAAKEYTSLQSAPTEVSPDEVIRDDIPLRLLGPSSHIGISTSGPRRASPEGVYSGQEREVRIVPPHMYLTPGFGKGSDYLRMYPDPSFTEASLQKYMPMEDMASEPRPGLPTLIFTQTLAGGLSALPTPPGFRPVSVFLEGNPVPVTIASSGTGFFTMYTAEKTLPPGLTIQYEPYTLKDHTLPTDKQTAVTADFDHLDTHWKDLVRELNSSTLTPKQKVDIILRAWTKSFKYDKTQEAFDTYKDYRTDSLRLNTEIINNAIGNCGYADRGFYSLVSLIGVPIQPMVTYLSDGKGNFRMDTNLHANTRVYLNGHWVEVEPQTNYIEDGYTVQPIPTEAKERIGHLLSKIPKAPRNVSINQQGQEGQRIRTVRENLPEALDNALSTIQAARVSRYEETETPFNQVNTPTIGYDVPPEKYTSPPKAIEIAIRGLTATLIASSTTLAAMEWGPSLLAKINSITTEIATRQPEQNSTNDSLAETLRRIHEQFSHLPPALLIPLVILMSGISYRAGYRRAQKESAEN